MALTWPAALQQLGQLQCCRLQSHGAHGVYGAALRALRMGRGWQRATSLLEEMHQQEVPRNIIVYNKALSVLEGQWQDALCILKQLQGDELQPDLLTFSSLISCSLRGSASESALFLWSELLRHQVEPDYICLNSAVNACAATGAWPSAIFFLQEVKRLKRLNLLRHLQPESDNYTILYNLAINSCGTAWPAAFHLLQDFKDLSGRASIKTYGSLANACAKALQWQRALSLFGTLDEEMLEVDLITSSAILNALELRSEAFSLLRTLKRTLRLDAVAYNGAMKGCDWRTAETLLREMQQDLVEGGVATYNALLTRCERSAAWLRATHLLQEAVAEAVAAVDGEALVAYNATLGACRESGLWSLALGLLAEMLRAKLPPNVISFSSAISACEKSGQWQHALSLLRDMGQLRVAANLITYNAAIGSCARCGQWQHAELLLRELQEAHEADIISYNSTLSVYTLTLWRRAVQLFHEIRTGSSPPCQPSQSSENGHLKADEITYALAINVAFRAGKWQLVQVFLENLPSDGLNGNVNIMEPASEAFHKAARHEQLLKCLDVVDHHSCLELQLENMAFR